MTDAIRILGIDPGLRHTGWGVIEQAGSRLSHVANGVIEGPGKERRDDQNTDQLETHGLANTVCCAAHGKAPIFCSGRPAC